jgi:DNA primase
MVSPAKGIWKILVLEKGNSVAFVMEHEHFTYPEAIRYLARIQYRNRGNGTDK